MSTHMRAKLWGSACHAAMFPRLQRCLPCLPYKAKAPARTSKLQCLLNATLPLACCAGLAIRPEKLCCSCRNALASTLSLKMCSKEWRSMCASVHRQCGIGDLVCELADDLWRAMLAVSGVCLYEPRLAHDLIPKAHSIEARELASFALGHRSLHTHT